MDVMEALDLLGIDSHNSLSALGAFLPREWMEEHCEIEEYGHNSLSALGAFLPYGDDAEIFDEDGEIVTIAFRR